METLRHFTTLDKYVTKSRRSARLAVSETCHRATTGYMNRRAQVAYDFWLRIERERVSRQWTKERLSKASGVSRPTINNLARTGRPPLARVVHALADALEIDRSEAEVLAGLLPGEVDDEAGDAGVVLAIKSSTAYTGDQKKLLLDVVSAIDKANGQSARTTSRSGNHPVVRDDDRFEAR